MLDLDAGGPPVSRQLMGGGRLSRGGRSMGWREWKKTPCVEYSQNIFFWNEAPRKGNVKLASSGLAGMKNKKEGKG